MAVERIVLDRRAEIKARHREAILDAADALIRERGKPQFSVDELAERADVSRRTVFNHFSSLDEVVVTACTRVLSNALEELSAGTAYSSDFDGNLVTLFDALTTAVRGIDLPPVVAYLWGVLASTEGDSRSHHPLGDIISRATERVSAQISSRGIDADDFEVAVLVSSLVNGVAVVSTHWIAQTGAVVDDSSRAQWDDLLERLITSIRTGYSPSP